MLMLGGLLVCIALLVFASLILVFRRPAAPRWTTRWGVGEVVSVMIVSFLTMGIGSLGAGVIDAYEQGIDPIDLGLLIVVLAVTAVVWRRLKVRERLRLLERPAAPGHDDRRLGSAVPEGPRPVTAANAPSRPAPTERAA